MIADFFYHLPDWVILIIVSGCSILFSIMAITLLRRHLPLHTLYKDNPVLGSIASLIGIIYGVLAGLMALYLMNNNAYTEDAVLRESSAIANIYRGTKWFKEPVRTEMQNDIRRYLKAVINEEWPVMREGLHVMHDHTKYINSIDEALIDYKSPTPTELLIINNMMLEIKSVYDARQQRIHVSDAALDWGIWVVILIGTILTLSINFLFGMDYRLHIFAVSAAALMTASILYLLITLDRPFRGEFAVQPDDYKLVLEKMDRESGKQSKRDG